MTQDGEPHLNDVANRFRAQMPVASRWIYLDHSAVGPLPAPTQSAISNWLTQATEDGDVHWLDWFDQLQQLRQLAASLLAASPAEIALLPNTTAGINVVAEGFPWQHGDNVVVLQNEFPSNLFPWVNLTKKGVQVRQVPVENGRVDPQRIADHCDEQTRIVSVSWVGYATGWRLDVATVAEIAHRHGGYLFLDAIQGLGVFPLDVAQAGVDFLAADGHKWMLGPEGAGIFFAKQDLLPLLQPTGIGWNSVKNAFQFRSSDFELKESAARYEGGTMNMAGFIGLRASLEMLCRLGLGSQSSPIAEHVLEVTRYAANRLTDIGAKLISPAVPGSDSGVLTFELDTVAPEQIRNACRDDQIVVSCRGGGVRMSPHGYILKSDIDQLIDVIRRLR